jgi:type VI secretion system protein ImpH
VGPALRRTEPSIEEALFGRGYEFDFFQAVRLLARMFPAREAVGGSARPREECARFGARLSLAFPPSAIHDIERVPDSDEPVRMTVAFLALTGTQGILPFHYTERMIARKAARDTTLAAFLDLFNHRLVSLFYRAWEKHHPPVLLERYRSRGDESDPFTLYLYHLIGMGTDHLRGRMRVADESLLRYAGLIAQRPHSVAALRAILRDYFSVPVEIDQYIGCWYDLDEADRCYLAPEMDRNQLGEGACLGDQVWDQQSRFRLRIGPLGLDRFMDFLPPADGMMKLVELTRYVAGQSMMFEVQVFLRAAEVPFCRLDDEGFDAPRLGWLGWLKTTEFTADAGDAVSAWVS